jgi:hypothetical protein
MANLLLDVRRNGIGVFLEGVKNKCLFGERNATTTGNAPHRTPLSLIGPDSSFPFRENRTEVAAMMRDGAQRAPRSQLSYEPFSPAEIAC